MSKWRTAGFMLSAAVVGSSVSAGAVFLYWKMETPPALRPVIEPLVLRTKAASPNVVGIPTKQYEYLGPYAFNTETIDSAGEVVWATQWVHYDPEIKYKFIAPSGLEAGEFSVFLNIDYALNPVARAEGAVKFLDLTIDKEENDGNTGAD